MALKFAMIALGVVQLATTLPTSADSILEDLLMVDDTVSVGSYIRETRAAAVSSKYEENSFKQHSVHLQLPKKTDWQHLLLLF